MSDPTVSVVIPCFNQGRFLGEAIESVCRQTVRAAELLVVDDGSTDLTSVVARRYSVVRYLSQPNLGLARARNRGLRASTGTYLVFLDADDRLRPGALEAGVRELGARPGAAMTYGRCERMDEQGRPLPTPAPAPLDRDAYASLLRENPIWTPGVAMFRREICGEALGFDPQVDPSADYELYLRLARLHPVHEHAEVVAEYRRHPGSMSHDAALMLQTTIQVMRRQRPHLDRPWRVHAYREGLRGWRRFYGEQLVERLRAEWQHGRSGWPQVVRTVALLARHYPVGLATHAVRKLQHMAGAPAERPVANEEPRWSTDASDGA